MKMSELKSVLGPVFSIGRTPHVIGYHGTGKTEGVRQWAKENGYNLVELRLGQMADPGDMLGLQEFIKNAKGETTHTKHILPDWFPRQPKTIIFLDEINRSHKDILQAVFELVYDKSMNRNALPEDCHVVAASNPPTDDYQVLDFSDSAFQDRFVHIQFTPTKDEWMGYGRSKKFAPSVLDFIAEFPDMLENNKLQAFDLSFVQPSRRSWEAVSALEAQTIEDALRLELIMGIVGTNAAHSYNTFKKSYAKTVKAADVFADYEKVRLDVQKLVERERNDLLSILTMEIVEVMTARQSSKRSEIENLFELVRDLPTEHAVGMLKGLSTAEGFMEIEGEQRMWAFNNQQLLDILSSEKQARKEARAAIEKKKKDKSK